MVIGFWNITNKELSDALIDLVAEHQIDILVLAEANDDTVLKFITKSSYFFSHRPFIKVSDSGTKIVILTNHPISLFQNKSNLFISPRWLIYQIVVPNIITFNLVSVHFHSKVNWSKESLALECVNLSRDISVVEKNTNCDETILIGDFNMNPFEDGLVAYNGLNAIQDLEYVLKRPKGRNIDGIDYPYFYNPMWNFFGDYQKPLGTHYFRAPGHISQEWNIYDQVMFRGSIKKYFDRNSLKIIDNVTHIGSITDIQLTNFFNRPNKKKYSDHLPITFKLKV